MDPLCQFGESSSALPSEYVDTHTRLALHPSPLPSEYAETLHLILSGLEAGSLAPWKLGVVSTGYLSLVLFAVYLNSSELRLPVVQYSTAAPAPPKVGNEMQYSRLGMREAAENRSQLCALRSY